MKFVKVIQKNGVLLFVNVQNIVLFDDQNNSVCIAHYPRAIYLDQKEYDLLKIKTITEVD